jgi:tetratricopeptide (TPR) repeat protein
MKIKLQLYVILLVMLTCCLTPLLWADEATVFDQAVAAYELGEFQKARDLFLQALEQQPDQPIIMCWAGSAALQVGELEEAEKHLTEALAKQPEYPEAHNNLGNVYLAQGKLPQAAEQYREALKHKSDYVDARYNLANLLAKQGKFEQAFNEYNRAIQLAPDDADIHLNFGHALWQAGQADKATREYEAANALRPGNPGILNALGALHLSSDNNEAAVEAYEVVVEADPNFAEAQLGLGIALYNLDAGGVQGATYDVVFDRVQILDPASTNQDHRVLHKVLSFTGDVSGDFLAVKQADSRDLAQSRVRLLGCLSPHSCAHTATLRRPLYLTPPALERIPSDLQCRCFRFSGPFLTAVAH